MNEGYATFEFKCYDYYTNAEGKKIYWSPVYDYTGDGGGTLAHNTAVWYGDNACQGTGIGGDAWICLYYRYAQQNPSYSDDIWVVQNENTNYDEFYEYSNIVITGTLSTLTPSTYVQLNHDGSQFEGGIYGGTGAIVSNKNRYEFVLSFNPTSRDYDGSWNCTLMRSGAEIDSYNFTIINRTELEYNGLITSSPNPQDVNKAITITYLYNKSYYDDKYAQVWVSTDSKFSTLDDTMLKSYIADDGVLTYYHDTQEVIYFMLIIDYNGSYYAIAISEPQVVGSTVLNQVGVKDKVIELSAEHPIHNQRCYGSHSYGGRQVNLFVNNVTLRDVSYEPYFDFEYKVTKSGFYLLEMKYMDSDGEWVLIDSTTYTVTDDREASSGEGGLTQGQINFLIGLGVTFAVGLMGFGIGTRMKSDDGELMIGMVFLVIGAVVATMFQLFDLWVPFLIGLFPSAYIVAILFGGK